VEIKKEKVKRLKGNFRESSKIKALVSTLKLTYSDEQLEELNKLFDRAYNNGYAACLINHSRADITEKDIIKSNISILREKMEKLFLELRVISNKVNEVYGESVISNNQS
jgi:hypothetical protein